MSRARGARVGRVSAAGVAALPLLDAPRRCGRGTARAVEELGIPERVLMESAGRRPRGWCTRSSRGAGWWRLVGRGNNGGDALVLLRCLRAWGREVAAVPVGGAEVDAVAPPRLGAPGGGRGRGCGGAFARRGGGGGRGPGHGGARCPARAAGGGRARDELREAGRRWWRSTGPAAWT